MGKKVEVNDCFSESKFSKIKIKDIKKFKKILQK